jgi:hypothetical protein
MSTTNLYEIIAAYLDESETHFQTDDENGRVFVQINGADGSWEVAIRIADDEEPRGVVIHSRHPARIPECNRLKVAEVLTRINYDLVFGNFELGMDDGTVFFKTALDLVDGQMTKAMFERLYDLNLSSMNQHYAKILSVGFGELEPEVLAAGEDRPEGVVLQ